MIRSIYVPRGGVGYIIGSVDINGNDRPSKVVRGDLNAVLDALAFSDKKKYKNPFVVFTYRDPSPLKELGGMKFLEKLMDDIEEVRFPRLKKNQFAYFFALHENVDGSTELNLFVVNVANKRQFSSYVDRRDFASDCIFSELIHEKYPKLVNPNAIENRRILAPNPRWDEHQLALFSEVKECAIDLCGDKNFVKNYSKSLLKTSLQAKGFTLEENANSSLFVKNDNAKIKLEGALLKKNPNLEELLNGTESPRKYKLSAAERLEISNDKRSEKILEKYNHLEKETHEEKEYRINTRIISEGRGALGTELEGRDFGDSEGRSSEATSLGHKRDGQAGVLSIPADSKCTGDDSSRSSKGAKSSDASNSERVEAEYPFGHEIGFPISSSSTSSSVSEGVKEGVKEVEEENGEESPFIDEIFGMLNGVIGSVLTPIKEQRLKEKLAAKAKLEAATFAAERARIAQRQQAMSAQATTSQMSQLQEVSRLEKPISMQKAIKPEPSLEEILIEKYAKYASNPACLPAIKSGVEFFEKEKIPTAEVLKRLSSYKTFSGIKFVCDDIEREKRNKQSQERGGFNYDR